MNGNLPDSWDQALIRSTPTKVAAPSYTYVVKQDTYRVVFLLVRHKNGGGSTPQFR